MSTAALWDGIWPTLSAMSNLSSTNGRRISPSGAHSRFVCYRYFFTELIKLLFTNNSPLFNGIYFLINSIFYFFTFVQYLNSGAGAIGGAFVHQTQFNLPKLSGWFSNRNETRMQQKHTLELAVGADAYRLCNPPPNLIVLHKAGLDVLFELPLMFFIQFSFDTYRLLIEGV